MLCVHYGMELYRSRAERLVSGKQIIDRVLRLVVRYEENHLVSFENASALREWSSLLIGLTGMHLRCMWGS